MAVLDNVSLPRNIPNHKTAEDWDIGSTLALIQRAIGLDSLVQLGSYVDPDTNILYMTVSNMFLMYIYLLHGDMLFFTWAWF